MYNEKVIWTKKSPFLWYCIPYIPECNFTPIIDTEFTVITCETGWNQRFLGFIEQGVMTCFMGEMRTKSSNEILELVAFLRHIWISGKKKLTKILKTIVGY